MSTPYGCIALSLVTTQPVRPVTYTVVTNITVDENSTTSHGDIQCNAVT